ncbi:MAG: isoleucine--tRNA ligase [Candidatus Falkowbacteria bacterium]
MPNKKQEIKQSNNPFPAMEEEVLNFWDKGEIFKKSVEKSAPQGDYIFYDGPPFATGEPHYGHLLSSISKDVMPRFWTMQGYRMERRWGWDCHGLPIENIIEQDLKISGKKEIEKIGIDKFCETCRSRVLEYADIWEVMIRRVGRWVEFKNSYKTMDLGYMESVWWGFKTLWNKDLIYQGRKVQLYCPRCETPISNFEVAMDNSYKDITETSVTAKFKVKNAKEKLGLDGDVYILAWTTTPWTLPGNVALAVGEDIDYVAITSEREVVQGGPKIKISETYIFAVNILPKQNDFLLYRDNITVEEVQADLLEGDAKKIAKKYGSREFKGKDLVGLEYEALFDVPAFKNSGKKVYQIFAADFVTTEDGTGVVHTAVVYGEDDYNLGIKYDLPIVPMLDEKGVFNQTVPKFKGVYFKKADKLVIEDLDKRGLVFATEVTAHSYPFCHRCETQLFYNAIPAWFMAVSKLKKRMLELNERINWFPEYLKRGRFALGIEQAPDWNISRNRYFGTPIPVWKCDKCGQLEVIGSVKELEEKSGAKNITDIHIHKVSGLAWKCSKCDGEMRRISEVLDCWVESGSMSFAQMHYPFENKKKFEANFPAQFISEYISQTRAWFYVMHVMAVALFDSNSFENVIATGIILNEKGDKMSKSKKNYPDPWKVINEYGVDSLRFYLMSSAVMQAENLFFNERDLRDIFRKNIMILWNVYKFYEMYAPAKGASGECSSPECENILDKWILAKLNILAKEVTENMKAYNLPKATRPVSDFINDFSTWYIRRSRDRFKSDDEADKKLALHMTKYVLTQLAKTMAPFTPFIAESLWQKVTGYNFKDENKSIHLTEWPLSDDPMEKEDMEIIKQMEEVRKIVELGLKVRDEAGIKVRQTLNELRIINYELRIEYKSLIKDELNVKNVVSEKGQGELKVELDTTMTDDLKFEGLKREVVRLVNNMRKQVGLTIKDKIVLSWQGDSELIKNVFTKMAKELKKDTLSEEIIEENIESAEEVKVNGEIVKLEIKKI